MGIAVKDLQVLQRELSIAIRIQLRQKTPQHVALLLPRLRSLPPCLCMPLQQLEREAFHLSLALKGTMKVPKFSAG